jgi:transposase
LADFEIVARVERRRKWSTEEKAALLAEVEAEGGKVRVVARRHRISESLLYSWRTASRTATSSALDFVPLGILDRSDDDRAMVPTPARSDRSEPSTTESRVGVIEVDLPNGVRLRVDAFVNEKALSRVLRAMKGVL